MEYSSLNGKVAIVTGAASGIGAAIATTFAENGVKLSLIDMDGDGLQIVAENCFKISKKFNNPEPFIFVGDLTIDANRQNFVDDTVERFGRIDILVNNAGIYIKSSMLDSNMEMVDKMFSVLLRAPYDMCRLSTKHLIESKGCIVNIASVAGHRVVGNPAYCAAKAAIINLTKSIAKELAPYEIRANSVSPGGVKTNILRKHGSTAPDRLDEKSRELNLLKRIAEPEEIAAIVAFLVSDKNKFMTGTDVLVDGGGQLK